jgi:signal transduction histidine kinase
MTTRSPDNSKSSSRAPNRASPERPAAIPYTAPPSTFWARENGERENRAPQRRDDEARARENALRTLDEELERLRASPIPRPNSVTRYALYFVLFMLLLSIRDIRMIYRPEGSFLTVERLVEGLAQDNLGLLDWGLVFHWGNNALLLRYNIFLNMLYAAGLGTVLFLRNRDKTNSRLIDRQNRELSILNRRQAIEVEESSRLLRDLGRAQMRLLSAEKLASIGRLSATLAHEIRNPLGIIASSAGMVAEDLDPASPQGQALELIRQEIQRLNKIISDLLNFARPRPPHPTYHDLNDLVRVWIAPHQDALGEKHVQLLADLEPALPEVFIDSDQLYQAFLNLLLNASEALDEHGGGTIVVTTRTESREVVAIELRDNADGIPPDILAQVFEPFFTTKTTGSGLGLAVVKQTVESMGGMVEMISTRGEGTRVRLRIPTGPAPAQAESRLPTAPTTASPSDATRVEYQI